MIWYLLHVVVPVAGGAWLGYRWWDIDQPEFFIRLLLAVLAYLFIVVLIF